MRRSAALILIAVSTVMTVVLAFRIGSPSTETIAAVAVIIPTFLAVALGLLTAENSTQTREKLITALENEWTTRRFDLLGTDVGLADLTFRVIDDDSPPGADKEAYLNLSGLHGFYSSLKSGRLVVLGKPGSGKTVLAIELLVHLLHRRRNDGLAEVPVLLSLAGWNPAVSLDAWIVSRLVRDYRLTRSSARSLVDQRLVLPLLDGLDEMEDLPSGPDGAAGLAAKRLNAALKGPGLLPMVVTCRTDYYTEHGGLCRIKNAAVIEIDDLGEPEINTYLTRRYRDHSQPSGIPKDWNRVLTRLHAKSGTSLRRGLSTPWLLTIAVIACDAGAITPDELLRRRSKVQLEELLLPALIPSALRMHPPKSRQTYSPEKVERWLARLDDHLKLQRVHGRSGTDINLNDLWRLAGDRRPRLLHAFFALPGAGLLCLVGAEAVAGTGGIILTAAFLMIGFSAGAWAAFDKDPAPSNVNFRQLFHGRSAIAGTILGSYTLVSGMLTSGILVASTTAIAASVAGALIFGLRAGAIGAVKPESALRNDLYFGLTLGVVGGAFVGLPGGLKGGLLSQIPAIQGMTVPTGAVLGLFLGLVAGLALGSRVFVRYLAGVLIEASRGRLPFRPAAFLAWGRRAGLLRVSGSVYQFRHDRFRAWIGRSPRTARNPADGQVGGQAKAATIPAVPSRPQNRP